ncbi:MAG TPA: nicotinamide mononucleotide transporter [Planctomycetota bacterium]|nr:nicotinamide mononucleotide transporter [Planctomycetota bacterium]
MSGLSWLVALASLVGVVLNIRKRRACFAVWCCTNATWSAVDLHAGLHAQAALMAVYAGLAVWGFIAWRPREPA